MKGAHMKIIDINGNPMENPDLSLGWLDSIGWAVDGVETRGTKAKAVY